MNDRVEQNVWLTADVVEQIHQASLNGRDVSAFTSKLTRTTLAGLIEYGCLRYAMPQLPSLPNSITTSVLGRSLSTIVSALGLRKSGIATPISNSHVPKEVEFFTVQGEEQATSEPLGMLLMRFTQAAKNAGFSVDTANELQAAFNEMVENAVQHSNCPVPVVAGYHVRSGVAQFVVADVGRGVRSSLRENPRYATVSTDSEAVKLALHDGVSRIAERSGLGFRPIFKAIAADWGVLRFRSGKGCWTMDGSHLDADHGTLHFPPELPGFQIAVTCRTKSSCITNPLV